MGKIGLAVTPADLRLVYATIERDGKERDVYRSRDRGERTVRGIGQRSLEWPRCWF